MRLFKIIFSLFIFSSIGFISTTRLYAQVQLVLLKGEHVKLRLYPGDDFVYKLKGSKQIKSSYVNNLSEFAVYTHSDTIPFHTIDRLYFKQSTFYNRAGSRLFFGGLLLFIIDQVNQTLLLGNKPSLDGGVSIVSLSLVTVGLPMMLIKKKSQHLNYKYRLMVVQKGSYFYQD